MFYGYRERARWTLPDPDIMIEGNQTIIRNFSELISKMDRDANHVYQYLLENLVGGHEGNHTCDVQGKNPS